MEGKNEGLTIASSASTIVSLEAVRLGKAGLDAHHQIMMIRVPNTGDWARFDHESLTLKDLAYLTAKTGDEFAILRGKKKKSSCLISGRTGRITEFTDNPFE